MHKGWCLLNSLPCELLRCSYVSGEFIACSYDLQEARKKKKISLKSGTLLYDKLFSVPLASPSVCMAVRLARFIQQ